MYINATVFRVELYCYDALYIPHPTERLRKNMFLVSGVVYFNSLSE